jgi:hypothetical protein
MPVTRLGSSFSLEFKEDAAFGGQHADLLFSMIASH